MKYYGAPYGGIAGKYDLTGLRAFENPYEALASANHQWDSIPDNDISRLLVVIADGYVSDEESMAFFQFTDAKACASFIADKEEIIWSTADMHNQKWNGNAHMM